MAAVALVIGGAAPAQANWIADYFQAEDVCGPRFPGLNALLTRDGPGSLLRRPAEDWTRDDLASLPRLFSECRRIAATRGLQIDFTDSVPEFGRIVQHAWLEREQRTAKAEATARVKEDAAKQALAQAQADRRQTEAAQRLAERERAAARDQAEQEIARANALAAEAEARRDIDLARRRAAEAKAKAARAQAEAEEARRLVKADAGPARPAGVAESRTPPADTTKPPDQPAQAPPPAKDATARPAHIRIGQRAKVMVGFLGCRSIDDYRELKRLAFVARDALAAARYGGEHDCGGVEQGSFGTVEDFALFSDATCLREVGQSHCVWLPSGFLTRAE